MARQHTVTRSIVRKWADAHDQVAVADGGIDPAARVSRQAFAQLHRSDDLAHTGVQVRTDKADAYRVRGARMWPDCLTGTGALP